MAFRGGLSFLLQRHTTRKFSGLLRGLCGPMKKVLAEGRTGRNITAIDGHMTSNSNGRCIGTICSSVGREGMGAGPCLSLYSKLL